MKTNNKTEKQLRKLNSKLLRHLEKALEIMSLTKCPYFILNGYGSIFMDESYIKRHSIKISEEETKIIQIFKSKQERDEFYEKRLDLLTNEIKSFAKLMSATQNKNSFQNNQSKEIKIGKTLDDLLKDDTNIETNIHLKKDNPVIDVFPNITKDQAIEQVINGQKSKDWGMITNINKCKAKSKIEESYKSEDDK